MIEYGSNDLELRVFGLRRSGNHAVVNWISHCFQEQSVFWFNDIPWTEIGKGTIYTERNLGRYGKWRKRYNKASGTNIYAHELDHDIIKCNKKVLIHSYEDKSISKLQSHLNNLNNGESKQVFNVLILRDIKNLSASRMAKDKNTGILALQDEDGKSTISNFINAYSEYADYFLGNRHLDNLMCINYNAWYTDKEYREEICKSLGGTFSDNSKNIILPAGNGSTFTGMKKFKQSNAPHLSRYKQVENRKVYKKIMNESDIVNMSKQIFGT